MAASSLEDSLGSDILQRFVDNALLADDASSKIYDCQRLVTLRSEGVRACVHSRRFLDTRAVHSPMVTMVLVRTLEEHLCRVVPFSEAEIVQRWKGMRQVGEGMWTFLKGLVLKNVRTILTCTTQPMLLVLLRDGTQAFMTGECWDDTVTTQDGFKWIHACMYAQAFRAAACQFPLVPKIPEPSTWDVDTGLELKQNTQNMELAFAMGTHPRLGEKSPIMGVLTSDVVQLLHNLCFQSSWKDVSHEQVRRNLLTLEDTEYPINFHS